MQQRPKGPRHGANPGARAADQWRMREVCSHGWLLVRGGLRRCSLGGTAQRDQGGCPGNYRRHPRPPVRLPQPRIAQHLQVPNLTAFTFAFTQHSDSIHICICKTKEAAGRKLTTSTCVACM